MALGSNMKYSSLRDAYSVPVFNMSRADTERDERLPVYTVEKPNESAEPPQPVEKFHTGDDSGSLECSVVQEHCSHCSDCCDTITKKKKYGPIGTSLNELLNLILIFLLIWVLVFKPKM